MERMEGRCLQVREAIEEGEKMHLGARVSPWFRDRGLQSMSVGKARAGEQCSHDVGASIAEQAKEELKFDGED